MALVKLWNAVFGKRNSPEVAPTGIAITPSVAAAAPAAPATDKQTAAVVKTSLDRQPALSESKLAASAVVSTRGKSNAAPADTAKPKAATKTRVQKGKRASKPEPVVAVAEPPAPVLRMFRRKNNAWSKLVGNRSVQAILDLDFGDGKRATELLEALVDSDTPAIKYIAIDLFEAGGKGLTVREFHQKIRGCGGQPIAIPMDLSNGLRHLSQTIGTVDCIVLGNLSLSMDAETARWLQRVTAPQCLVLGRDAAGKWNASGQIKRAA